jgi:hypothetical protein
LIGSLRIPANKILHGKISKGGKRKITTNIIFDGKPAGKIRLDYSIEPATEEDVVAFLQAATETVDKVSELDQLIANDRAEGGISSEFPSEQDVMSAISDT